VVKRITKILSLDFDAFIESFFKKLIRWHMPFSPFKGLLTSIGPSIMSNMRKFPKSGPICDGFDRSLMLMLLGCLRQLRNVDVHDDGQIVPEQHRVVLPRRIPLVYPFQSNVRTSFFSRLGSNRSIGYFILSTGKMPIA